MENNEASQLNITSISLQSLILRRINVDDATYTLLRRCPLLGNVTSEDCLNWDESRWMNGGKVLTG